MYVGNLPKDFPIPEGELRDAFSRFGALADVWIAKKPAGFGFVQFVDQRDAEDAVKETDGVNGWKVEISSSRGPRVDGRGCGETSSRGRVSRCILSQSAP